MTRTIPKRQLKRRCQRIGEMAYLALVANRISDGTHKVSVIMCRECINDERIGEEYSTRPFLW